MNCSGVVQQCLLSVGWPCAATLPCVFSHNFIQHHPCSEAEMSLCIFYVLSVLFVCCYSSEQIWFESHSEYSEVAKQCGVGNLAQRINVILGK
jgi:hypothetical protein